MTTVTNGHATTNGVHQALPLPAGRASVQYSDDEIRTLVAALEVPFDPRIVEWRVCSTSYFDDEMRGQVVAYADSRAYQDRLNALFTPAGWTRKYERQFSGEVQRGRDDQSVAKVFVTCELTIHGLGFNSSTGEAWADDDNAGTVAEAQSFKRAASCFGLGRYLYDIQKEWVYIDDRKRPLSTPTLPEWATPEGWTKGLRPEAPAPIQHSDEPRKSGRNPRRKEQTRRQSHKKNPPSQSVNRILELQPFLIHRLYRGILKNVAQVWNPQDIGDPALEQQVLEKMEEAELWRRRFDRALQLIGQDLFHEILRTLKIRSFQHIDSLETFSGLVRSMEEKAGTWVPPALPPMSK